MATIPEVSILFKVKIADEILTLDDLIQAWNQRSQWISVDTPPEFSDRYLVIFCRDVCILPYDIENGWLWGDGALMRKEDSKDITHWQFLPPLPDEEE